MQETHFLIKYHWVFSLGIGVGFLVALQSAAAPSLDFIKLVLYFGFFLALASLYNHWYLTRISKRNIWTIVRMGLLLIGGVGLFLSAPTPAVRGLFLIVSVAVITFFEFVIGTYSENLLLSEVVLSSFGGFTGLAAEAFLYSPQYRFFCLLGAFAFSLFLARSFFENLPVRRPAKLISAFAIAWFMGQIFWAASFLPSHFFSIAVLLTGIFYTFLAANFHYLFNNLDHKKLQFHLLVLSLCVGIVFLSTPWGIIE